MTRHFSPAGQGLSAGARALALGALAALTAACAGTPGQPSVSGVGEAGARPHYKVGAPYRINGRYYRPAVNKSYEAVGLASWYGDKFHGRPTANGEIFDKRRYSAAHKTLPLPTEVEVENLEYGRRIVVRVNDRGPFVDDRLIDLSEAAARALGFKEKGLARVRVRYIGDADIGVLAAAPGDPPRRRAARAPAPRPAAPVASSRAPVPARSIAQPTDVASLIAVNASYASVATAPAPARVFWVEVGRFASLEAVAAAGAALSGEIETAIFDADGVERYALRLGPFESAAAADAAAVRAKAAGFAGAAVIAEVRRV